MLKFWNTNKVGDISKAMSEQLATQYSLGEDELKRLRYASKPGKFVGQKAAYIRIFDPALLKNGTDPIRRYDDLTTQIAAILFEGKSFAYESSVGGKFLDLSDRRLAI